MTLPNRSWLAGFWLVFATMSLAAQQEQLIKTHILTYAPNPLPNETSAFYQSGKEIYSFQASSSSLGIPVLYEGSPRFTLRENESEFLNLEGRPPSPPLAQVDLPLGADTILILAISDPAESEKLRLVAYDISSQNLKEGDYRIFNFSTHPVVLALGAQQAALKPGDNTTLRDRKWTSEALALPLQIAISQDNTKKIVYSSFREHFPQRRSLLFMFNGKHRSQPITFSSFNAITALEP